MREARVLPGPLCCPRRASVDEKLVLLKAFDVDLESADAKADLDGSADTFTHAWLKRKGRRQPLPSRDVLRQQLVLNMFFQPCRMQLINVRRDLWGTRPAARRAEYLKKRREYEERRAAAIAKMGLLPYIKSPRRR